MDKEKLDNLDALIDAAMRAEPERHLTGSFTDRFIQKVQRRILWLELITDFTFKMGVAMLALALFGAIYYFVMVKDVKVLLSFLSGCWKIIAAAGVVILFTFFTDQVFLKYILRTRQEE